MTDNVVPFRQLRAVSPAAAREMARAIDEYDLRLAMDVLGSPKDWLEAAVSHLGSRAACAADQGFCTVSVAAIQIVLEHILQKGPHDDAA